MGGGLTLVSGQSGVAIKECIKRLGHDYICIEDEIKNLYKKKFDEFLIQPQSFQYALWSKSFQKIINDKLIDKHDILTFHSVYYHQSKREQYSPINFDLIKTHLTNKVDKVIVFIDDIYNVYRRLMATGQMYSKISKSEDYSKLDAIYQSIFNLITLLHWREMEISVSRIISKIINAPFYIVATAHPTFMLKRLFEKKKDELKIFYLSHPISEVRKQSVDSLSSFVGELNIICRTIINRGDKTILFFPTSIDEKIIKQSSKKKFLPELDKRWSLPYTSENELRPSLSDDIASINPLNPQDYSPKRKDNEAISRSLSILDNFIHQRQIISRDYSLVEQCKNGVIAIRPFYNGERSDGMIGELGHNFILMHNSIEREAIIYTCINDIDKFKIEKFLIKFIGTKDSDLKKHKEKWIKDRFIIRKKSDTELFDKLEREVEKSLDYTKIQIIDRWKADEFGRSAEAKKQIIESIRKELRKDEIAAKILTGNFQDRTIYRFIDERDFTSNIIKELS